MPNDIINLDSIYSDESATVFKSIDIDDVNLTPFLSHKSWTITSGSATSSVLPLTAIYSDISDLPPIGTELTYTNLKNIDNSLQTVTYFSVNHLFYKRKDQFNSFGNSNLNQIKKFLYQSASILSFPGKRVGLYIKPTSFELTTVIPNITTGSGVYGSGVYGAGIYGASSSINYTMRLKSDKYGNLYDTSINSSSIVPGVVFYEGFNEYFDTNRISYESSNVTYIGGVNTNDGVSNIIGLSAKFNGNGYIKQNLDQKFNRDGNFAISFYISASTFSGTDKLILAKSNQSNKQYPFKLELSGSNQIKFTAAADNDLKLTITSSILPNGWNHIICQKSESYMQIYTNASLEYSASNPAFVIPNTWATASGYIDNTDPLYIGGFDTNSSNLTGCLDEIRIFNKSLTTSNISALSNRSITGSMLQTNIVGNVYHEHGMVIISSPNILYKDLINTPFTASYRSTVKTTEMSVVARVPAGDFNMSLNKTLLRDDLETYQTYTTSSVFSPYITTVGLYSPGGVLVAVAKLAQPVKKRDDVDLNFLVQIDLDLEYNK